ncbi:MAG: hypothetical protein WKF88_10835 [Ferruginibacter sp.]
MKKTIIACFVLLALYSAPAFSQTGTTHEEQNRYAQKLTSIFNKSSEIVLPDSVYRILKDYAFTTGQQEALILKQAYIVKMVYNTEVSREDRLMVCDELIRQNSRPGAGIPVFLFQNMKTLLTSQK